MYQLKPMTASASAQGQPLLVMAGLNVLEDEGLALEFPGRVKQICSDLCYLFFLKRVLISKSISITSHAGPDG
ncbi:MAG: hypothetical protein CM15mP21_3740 [Hyphomicrobiales bacterium]|nr:MAG: hypothetical protein CM15mP21_3740 [Hyphomicrobiales bacterium]